MPLPPPKKNPNLPPVHKKPTKAPDDPHALYVVRDKDWAQIWAVNLSLTDARLKKEQIAGAGKSRTVRYEPMPTDEERLEVLRDLGWLPAVAEAEPLTFDQKLDILAAGGLPPGALAEPARPPRADDTFTLDQATQAAAQAAQIAALEAAARAKAVPLAPLVATVTSSGVAEVVIDPVDDLSEDPPTLDPRAADLSADDLSAVIDDADLADLIA